MAQPLPEPAETLRAYVRIQRAADRDILRALREAYKDVNAQLGRMGRAGGTELDRARALAIKKAILEAQADLFERTGQIIQRRRVEAAARAIQVAGRYDEAAFAAVSRERDARALAEGLEATEARAIDAVEARISGASRVALSDRVYKTQSWSSGVLEKRINSALARGLNAQEFAREIQPLVNPNTPGGPRYAALRLARTEINNAYHAMAVAAAQAKPWITKMEWHLSKSHPKRPGGPEKCELLVGLHPVDEVPMKPHPQCMCYVTPVVDANDDAFLDALVGGEFDDFIDKFADRQGIDLGPSPEGAPDALPVVATPAEIAPAAPETRRVDMKRGRDLSDQMLQEFEAVTEPGQPFMTDDNRWTTAETRGFGRPIDPVLQEVLREQGYGTPEVTDSATIDARIAEGWVEAWRGAVDHAPSQTTGATQMRRLREDGDFEPGTGIYGNGWYFSMDERVSRQFSGESPEGHREKPGAVVRVAMSPQARIVIYEDLLREHEEWNERIAAIDVRYVQMRTAFTDLGRFAAMRGYDGIWIQNEQDGAVVNGRTSAAPQIVIFNREVMAIEREDRD